MDFTKFVSLLEESALYFARGDQFGDQFEGSRPRRNVEARFRRFCELNGKRPDELSTAERQAFKDDLEADGRLDRQFVAINCWHINDFESAAMWNLYLKSNEGIAIKSTYDRLARAISQAPGRQTGCTFVHIGLVRYIDYSSDEFEEKSKFSRFLHKRKSFEHERELRAMAESPMQMQGGDFIYAKRKPLIGVGAHIPVDLETLIGAIYIAPNASWLELLVLKVMNKYGVRAHVRRTSLDESPLF
ncbi:MAG TPA: hypothetical protein VN699_00835 [Pirellulales bacterium]|nr:hypothetical protein [Pirellulales bacterium]